MKFTHIFIFLILFLILIKPLYAKQMYVLEKKDVIVLYDMHLKPVAKEVGVIYPAIKADLERIFRWDLNIRPTVALMKDRKTFQRMAESPLTVAFAIPAKNLIVIDYSRISMHPFSLDIVLKHELCHLLLHHHIKEVLLPRWLDEGIAQWTSDGFSDVISNQNRSLLNQAAFRGKFIYLGSLEKDFPTQNESLLLAYEESKNFLVYLIGRFGKDKVMRVLDLMKKGDCADVAVLKSLSTTIEKLEREWHHSLRQKMTWFTYLSNHLYDILFVLMALITILAFVKIMIRKRAYRDNDSDDTNVS